MTIGGPVAVQAVPIMRGDMQLQPDDIEEAIAWFKDKTGQEPKLVILNRKNEHLAEETGDDVKVEYLGGVLRGEVWLSATDNFVTPKSATGLNGDYEWGKRNEIQMRTIVPLGRKPIDLPMGKLLELRGQGLDFRAIAKRLIDEGIRTTHMAIKQAIDKKQ